VTAPASPRYDQPLGRREIQVIRLAALGHSNAVIGQRLGISPNTVSTHLQTVSVKLGARDRAHASMLAARRGYIDLATIHPRGTDATEGEAVHGAVRLLLPVIAAWAQDGPPDSIQQLTVQISNALSQEVPR